MAQISAQTTSEAGAALTYSSASGGGDSFTNTGKELLHVKNGGGSSVTVTLKSRNTTPVVDGYGSVSKPDVAITIPAGADRIAGPFPLKAFNDANGRLSMTFSSTTSVSAAVIATR
ncbi:hypothetical protein [Azospirillum brasilense]|uniref:hypothetical protein n=1 Tax=Azospirillum brasilense TaxID=192 RepID=UPI001EDB18BE|nr:hypothetical protein [Azospirillum brasilense]UKJ74479.1 hypothetical protein H1Q64_18120 [Azospirillum brasilense]